MKHLSPQQQAALLALLAPRRDAASLLIRMLRETAMRCDELAKLRLADVNQVTGAVTVTASKGSRNRVMYLLPETLELLSELAAATAPSASVMSLANPAYNASPVSTVARHAAKQWLRTEWRKLRLFIDARDVGLHGLRHTAAIKMLAGTGDLRQTQAILGHKDINNTTKYLEAIDQDAAALAFRKLVS